MVPMPLVSKPFQWITMGLVGPLPYTQRGNCFVLTICNYATLYPEAISLPSTEAPHIGKELIGVFACMGVPEDILSDQSQTSVNFAGGCLPSPANQEDQDLTPTIHRQPGRML